jgi:hypothetical protein
MGKALTSCPPKLVFCAEPVFVRRSNWTTSLLPEAVRELRDPLIFGFVLIHVFLFFFLSRFSAAASPSVLQPLAAATRVL